MYDLRISEILVYRYTTGGGMTSRSYLRVYTGIKSYTKRS